MAGTMNNKFLINDKITKKLKKEYEYELKHGAIITKNINIIKKNVNKTNYKIFGNNVKSECQVDVTRYRENTENYFYEIYYGIASQIHREEIINNEN